MSFLIGFAVWWLVGGWMSTICIIFVMQRVDWTIRIVPFFGPFADSRAYRLIDQKSIFLKVTERIK